MSNNYLIHLIETFDHNAGTTTCGEVLDTWTIKYPELDKPESPLKYGYAKSSDLDLFEINCEICKDSKSYCEAKQFLLDWLYREEFKEGTFFTKEMIDSIKIAQLKMRKEYEEKYEVR